VSGKTDDIIRTSIKWLDVPTGFLGPRKRYRFVGSNELLRTLRLIQKRTKDETTKEDLDILIDQILKGNTNI
jgi:hypothetical protein